MQITSIRRAGYFLCDTSCSSQVNSLPVSRERLILKLFFKQRCPNILWFQRSHVRIFCFSLSHMSVRLISFGFGLFWTVVPNWFGLEVQIFLLDMNSRPHIELNTRSVYFHPSISPVRSFKLNKIRSIAANEWHQSLKKNILKTFRSAALAVMTNLVSFKTIF